MLLPAGYAPPQRVGPQPLPGDAPARIEIRPAHVRRKKQFHPTPQAPLTRVCTREWPQLGGSIQCHGDAADEAQPFFENCQVADYRRLREGQYTARKMTCQSVLGAAGPPPDPGSLTRKSPLKNLPAPTQERAQLSSQTGGRRVAFDQGVCCWAPGALPYPDRSGAYHGSDERFGRTGSEHSSLLGGKPRSGNPLNGG